jgi:hypothetical protein
MKLKNKLLERLKNTVNKYKADLRPTSQNGSWSKLDDPVYISRTRNLCSLVSFPFVLSSKYISFERPYRRAAMFFLCYFFIACSSTMKIEVICSYESPWTSASLHGVLICLVRSCKDCSRNISHSLRLCWLASLLYRVGGKPSPFLIHSVQQM